MNKKTLKALRGSIQKWECICMGMIADKGTRNCPLCKMFFKLICEGCPVYKKTGVDSCLGSPYHDFAHVSYLGRCGEESASEAQEMLEFLESLLPENEK